MIRILHLSDFHYKSKHDADFKDIGKKIASAIVGQQIDFVIFSGDLVYDTNDYDKIVSAAKCFIEPIKAVAKIDNGHFLIAPGNHDMKRDAELPMIKAAFNSYKSYEQINEYASDRNQLLLSLANFENYNKFITDFYGGSMHIEPLYTYNTVSIAGKKIGLIAFNSAWRSYKSDEDRGHLVYPEFMVNEAFDRVGTCDLVICTQHHNLSDYTDSVCQKIAEIINEKCHILFTGHYHMNSIQTNHDSEIGLLHIIAPATYNRGDGVSKYGFSIVELDEDTLEGQIILFNKIDGNFIQTKQKPVSVPISQEKKQLNDFRKLLKKRYQQTIEKADALFVSGKPGVFKSLFKNPIIKNKSAQEILTSRKEGTTFSLTEILDKNKSAIIFGYNKKGKSSLLRWLELEVLNNCVSKKIIPYYIDYKIYKRLQSLDFEKEMHVFLEMSYSRVKSLFKEYTLLLLVDDLNPNDANFINKMVEELSEFPSSFFIATSAESLSKQCSLMHFEGTDIDKYYIHDITNKEVHQLTVSWPNINVERKREIEDKIMQISKSMHLSLNYWTVSLFLWIFEKTDNTNIHNNFELVKLYVDELLGKENFIKSQDYDVDYADLKSYLASLAERILYADQYLLSEKELIEFTENYREQNLKFTIPVLDLISYLLENAIIHKVEDKYTIRLKGVFEFLLALRMTKDDNLKRHVLEDKHAFLSFGNELEYYAGFMKDDFPTINKVFDSAKSILMPFTSKPDYYKIDERLAAKVTITPQDIHCTGSLIERLNATSEGEDQSELMPIQDTVMDETSLQPKVYLEEVPINSANVENILFILSRIYRNSNICNCEEMSKEMLDYILTGTCNLGYLIVDEAKDLEKQGEDNAEQWVIMVSNFIPIIMEAFLYDAISQRNLSEVFRRKLEELISNPKNNQLRIFLITFILVDLDFKSNFKLVTRALEYIDNKILRYAVLNKNLLLSIKYSDNKDYKRILDTQRKELLSEFGSTSKVDEDIKKKIQEKISRDNILKGIRNTDYK